MANLSLDTHPEVEQLQIERLRQMPPWRKMALVGEMNRTVRTLALAGSLASALHGVMRATMDADLVTETIPNRLL